MSKNIARIACRHPGKRLVITTGAEHRYILRELLAKNRDLAIQEFWDLLS